MGPNPVCWCPYKEEKNWIQRHTYTGKHNVKTGGMLPQARDCQKPPAAGSSEERFVPRAFKKSTALLSDIPDFLPPKPGANKPLLFKPPSLRSFVMAANLGNEYKAESS